MDRILSSPSNILTANCVLVGLLTFGAILSCKSLLYLIVTQVPLDKIYFIAPLNKKIEILLYHVRGQTILLL